MAGVRRILRILLNGITALSLVLCVTAVALWVRSVGTRDTWVRVDYVRHTGESRFRKLISDRGTIAWAVERPQLRMFQDPPRGGVWNHFSYPVTTGPFRLADELLESPTPLQRHGFIFHHGPQYRMEMLGLTPFVPQFVIALPLWFLAAASAFIPAVRVYSDTRKRRRRARGRCPVCAYDLRATPDRCPECGAVPSAGRAPAPEGGRR